jgi:hypothetical protein
MSPYAAASHVEALTEGRPAYSNNTEPSLDQVNSWLIETSGIIDGLLRQRGYAMPVASDAATSALVTLQNFNAVGGWYYVEAGAKTSHRLKEAKEAWDWAQKMLRDGVIELDLSFDFDETQPRGGFSSAATPFFTRNMQL